ncbi:hypothetical protein F5146DRAFT_1156413 [Armillaria mellea]|nr:hypothetical protein F5146DRAFT_1156413 [Armillaria mellea]
MSQTHTATIDGLQSCCRDNDDRTAILPKAKRKAEGEDSRVKKKPTKAAEDSDESLQETVKQLQIGSSLARLSITLQNQTSKDVEIKRLPASKVWYSSWCPGLILMHCLLLHSSCTQQARTYQDAYNNFTEAGYNMYCLSANKPGKQGKWKDKSEKDEGGDKKEEDKKDEGDNWA